MSEAEQSTAWNSHVSQAAKSFLKCAVAIDDRPFGGGKPAVGANVRQSKDAEPLGERSEPEGHWPDSPFSKDCGRSAKPYRVRILMTLI